MERHGERLRGQAPPLGLAGHALGPRVRDMVLVMACEG